MAQWHIEKLGDEYGQYTLVATCAVCGHERAAGLQALARLFGWEAKLADVARRMRCSSCGARNCSFRTFPPKKPRGYTSLPK